MQDFAWVRRVKLQQLRTVMVVARNHSLASAANELGLSQPAVTKILHELESDLGMELFVRTSRGTHATELGNTLAARASTVFAQLQKAAEEIHNIHEGLSGHVVIGTLLAGGANILPRAVARLRQRRPGVRVTIMEGTYDHLIPQLRQGALDLIVGRLPAYRYREGLEIESFYQEEIAFVARPDHPVFEQAQPSLADLRQWPWIMPLPDTTLRQMLESVFHERNLDLPVMACESLSVVTNRRLIIETDYIGTFPAQVVQPDIDAGLLSRIDMRPAISFGPVGISWMKDSAFSQAAQELVTSLRDIADNWGDTLQQ
ncbi:LysR substrate-binding domain-containing protein [Marinobacterium litorale]|uniref:LysR substrate-binding domain-containing protein n=1 Tax=Marinobacterium litorale TaxID=404770 RepID=UPI0004187E3A|nr:LysR substrate-binding domain-containing protein [Marinobacterium litorale]